MSFIRSCVIVATHLFGALSFLSCICVALEAWADWRANKEQIKTVARIQLAFQLPLGILSLLFALSFLLTDDLFMGNDDTW